MNTPPRIYIIVAADGSLEDISVLAKDHKERLLGFQLIEQLTEELEVFEARIKTRLAQLYDTQ